jgi:membrane protease YdiL (CAAX protease family)
MFAPQLAADRDLKFVPRNSSRVARERRGGFALNTRQRTAFFIPLLLVAVMYPVFQLAARAFGSDVGWYLGLVIYWLLWGAAYPLWLLGKQAIVKLIRPRATNGKILLLAAVPLFIVGFGRIVLGMEYEKASDWAAVALLLTAVGNGFFEELLWRGTYLELFPDRSFHRALWPSLWFALWHFAPGSVSPSSNSVLVLMIGAGFLGLYLSYLARQSGSIFWPIVVHTLAGIIMVI